LRNRHRPHGHASEGDRHIWSISSGACILSDTRESSEKQKECRFLQGIITAAKPADDVPTARPAEPRRAAFPAFERRASGAATGRPGCRLPWTSDPVPLEKTPPAHLSARSPLPHPDRQSTFPPAPGISAPASFHHPPRAVSARSSHRRPSNNRCSNRWPRLDRIAAPGSCPERLPPVVRLSH
jgi:hypothetical protein